jgi:hypothetical protein
MQSGSTEILILVVSGMVENYLESRIAIVEISKFETAM